MSYISATAEIMYAPFDLRFVAMRGSPLPRVSSPPAAPAVQFNS
jgi:hypothetical protein